MQTLTPCISCIVVVITTALGYVTVGVGTHPAQATLSRSSTPNGSIVRRYLSVSNDLSVSVMSRRGLGTFCRIFVNQRWNAFILECRK